MKSLTKTEKKQIDDLAKVFYPDPEKMEKGRKALIRVYQDLCEEDKISTRKATLPRKAKTTSELLDKVVEHFQEQRKKKKRKMRANFVCGSQAKLPA